MYVSFRFSTQLIDATHALNLSAGVSQFSVLRGINVAGQKKLKLADLQSLYEADGFKNVVTYMESGNVVFDSGNKDNNDLKKILEKNIEH